MADFLEVLQSGIERHGIAAKVVQEGIEPSGGYVVTYSAFRNWDIQPYLSTANISLFKNGYRIASADYHTGGGFDAGKWAGTAAKIDPLIDRLFENIHLSLPEAELRRVSSATHDDAVAKSQALADALERLDHLRKSGVLTDAEFQQQKGKLLGGQ